VRGCVMGILMEQKSPKALQEEIENLTLLFNWLVSLVGFGSVSIHWVTMYKLTIRRLTQVYNMYLIEVRQAEVFSMW
jgi:hypothetical protein